MRGLTEQCCQTRTGAICTAGIGKWRGLPDPFGQMAPGLGTPLPLTPSHDNKHGWHAGAEGRAGAGSREPQRCAPAVRARANVGSGRGGGADTGLSRGRGMVTRSAAEQPAASRRSRGWLPPTPVHARVRLQPNCLSTTTATADCCAHNRLVMAALPRRRVVERDLLRLWTLLMPCCGAAITRCGGVKAGMTQWEAVLP